MSNQQQQQAMNQIIKDLKETIRILNILQLSNVRQMKKRIHEVMLSEELSINMLFNRIILELNYLDDKIKARLTNISSKIEEKLDDEV